MNYKNKVLKFLRKVNSETWELTEPHLLYLDEAQANKYLQAMQNDQYKGGFHAETIEIIEHNLENMFKSSNNIDLVDLGPGYPDKSLPIALWSQDKVKLNYYPVDVSPLYLKIATDKMKDLCDKVVGINKKFEDLEKCNEYPKGKTTFVMLGLTFMNFDSLFILGLLKKIAGKNGHIIIATELLNKNIDQILKQYQIDEIKHSTFGPIALLGCDIEDFKYEARFNNNRVEATFIAKKNINLDKAYFLKNEKIITAISYRYSKKNLETILAKEFDQYTIYDSKSQNTALALCKI